MLRLNLFIVVAMLLAASTYQFKTLQNVQFDDAQPLADGLFVRGKLNLEKRGLDQAKLDQITSCILATNNVQSTMSKPQVLKYTIKVSDAVAHKKDTSMVKRPHVPEGFSNVIEELQKNVETIRKCSESKDTESMTYSDMVNEVNKNKKKPIIGLNKENHKPTSNEQQSEKKEMRPLPEVPGFKPKVSSSPPKRPPPQRPVRKDLIAKQQKEQEESKKTDFEKKAPPPRPPRKVNSFSKAKNFWKKMEKTTKEDPKKDFEKKEPVKKEAPPRPPRKKRQPVATPNASISHAHNHEEKKENVVIAPENAKEKNEKKEENPNQVNFFLRTRAKGFYKTDIVNGKRTIVGELPFDGYKPIRERAGRTYKQFRYLFIHAPESSSKELQEFQYHFQRVVEKRRLPQGEDYDEKAITLIKKMDTEVAVSGANFLIRFFRKIKQKFKGETIALF